MKNRNYSQSKIKTNLKKTLQNFVNYKLKIKNLMNKLKRSKRKYKQIN